MNEAGGVCYLPCPECETPVKMGLPRSSRVTTVERTSETTAGKLLTSLGPRRKRRPNRCERGHAFSVWFEF